MSARLLRLVVAGSLVLSLAAAGGALAAPPKPTCNLVQDLKGDGTGFIFTDDDYLPNNPQLDLISGDIASDGKTITAVIRTDELALSDPASPTGRAYYANFTVGDATLFLSASLDRSGAGSFSGGFIETRRTSLGAANGVVDPDKKEIRISAPVSLFAEKAAIKKGVKVQNLNLLAQRFLGVNGVGGVTPSADDAEGGKTYTVGTKSCVTVGK